MSNTRRASARDQMTSATIGTTVTLETRRTNRPSGSDPAEDRGPRSPAHQLKPASRIIGTMSDYF